MLWKKKQKVWWKKKNPKQNNIKCSGKEINLYFPVPLTCHRSNLRRQHDRFPLTIIRKSWHIVLAVTVNQEQLSKNYYEQWRYMYTAIITKDDKREDFHRLRYYSAFPIYLFNFQDSVDSRAKWQKICVTWRLVRRQGIYMLSYKPKQNKGKGNDENKKGVKINKNKSEKLTVSERERDVENSQALFSYTFQSWIYTHVTGNTIWPSSPYQLQAEMDDRPYRWKRPICSSTCLPDRTQPFSIEHGFPPTPLPSLN